ncbi:MAG: ATP-dependent zinc metalloprotease FtsH [Candidatus Nitrosotenuis sp.]
MLKKISDWFSRYWLTITVVVIISLFGWHVLNRIATHDEPTMSYFNFINAVHRGMVFNAIIQDNEIRGMLKTGDQFKTLAPASDMHMIDDFFKYDVDFRVIPPEKQSLGLTIFISWFPMLILIGVWIYFMKRQHGGGLTGFGKNKAKLIAEDKIKITFADVAGIEDAKADVKEMVDFLRDPQKFNKLGGKIPRGALLVGSPGTGKTMLAKAVAGEAGVPFFSISGSDFVEMFVGVGASRVRDLFEEAKKKAPCIIFIDEIDAIGASRGQVVMGNDERNQTLNQLLVEMDGFEGTEGIIVFAATNRVEILDQALLRPGRFDRQVFVNLPDINGREQILKVHTNAIPLGNDVNLNAIARGTPGFSGADLANLVNEAAILASRCNRDVVSMHHFEKAKDKILMGAERKSLMMTDEEKKLTAYHEAGHAVVGYYMPEHDPLYKVSIIPRGRALGITMFLPERDRVSMSKRKVEGQIASLYGGRIAEEIIAGADGITTGASNDIERATTLATKMVTEWGFSEKLKLLKYIDQDVGGMSNATHLATGLEDNDERRIIKEEIEAIAQRNYDKARSIIEANWSKMEAIAEALMVHETIDVKQLEEIMST